MSLSWCSLALVLASDIMDMRPRGDRPFGGKDEHMMRAQ